MSRTGYSWLVSATPSDDDYINTKALEGFARAFDRVLRGKYDLSGGAMTSVQTPPTAKTRTPMPMGEYREDAHLSFWHSFSFLKSLIRFRDNIRLRRYNREWIKNNIH